MDQSNQNGSQDTTMGALIFWNITKAMEKNPDLDIKEGLKSAQENLQKDPYDVNVITSQDPEKRHLACAFLAWQQLGHKDAESLYQFILTRAEDECCCTSKDIMGQNKSDEQDVCYDQKDQAKKGPINEQIKFTTKKSIEQTKADRMKSGGFEKTGLSDGIDRGYKEKLTSLASGGFSAENNPSIGPVLRLPLDTKIVMRVEASGGSGAGGPHVGSGLPGSSSRGSPRGSSPGGGRKKDLSAKIEKCCLDSACLARLTELDNSTKELRTRAAKLARREAERVELLERAEAAWRELEVGYQRRLRLALEKEQDAARQIQKMILERNGNKEACMAMVKTLKDRGDAAEVAKAKLDEVEKKVCALGCDRLRLSEESAKVESALADEQCKASQLDRDLQFKEEQAKRKVLNLESELDSRRALLCEAQRAMRAELNGLREQIKNVSKEFSETEAAIEELKTEMENLRQEKAEITEDLEGCLDVCDKNMKKKIDKLKEKNDELIKLKEQVVDCQCKVPTDAPVQMKRTPSFAALCQCKPEDNLGDSCSCTSLRTTLMSNMLSDLFGGLQSELNFTGSTMPCQLLKCLEDTHNWESNGVVKSNLRNFFSKLLIAELDIAIATAIENYHARWVGSSCADVVARSIPDLGDDSYDWQQKAVERKALKLANEMAEEMFKTKADELLRHTKEVLKAEGPPCKCESNKPDNKPAVFTCIVDNPPKIGTGVNTNPVDPGEEMTSVISCNCPPKTSVASGSSVFWQRTIQDVGRLKIEIESLRKDSIKKEDLMMMEENIAKLVQRVSGPDEPENILTTKKKLGEQKSKSSPNEKVKRDKIKDDEKVKVIVNDRSKKESKVMKTNFKPSLSFNKKNTIPTSKMDKLIFNPSPKTSKKSGLQTYAVNFCMCGSRRAKKTGLNSNEEEIVDTSIKSSNDFLQETKVVVPSVKQSKPILAPPSSTDPEQRESSESRNKPSCGSNCVCFHKVPSNKSIDKLLETLMKWKCDLNGSEYEDFSKINGSYNIDALIESNSHKNNNSAIIQELVNSMSSAIRSRSMTRNTGRESQTQKTNAPLVPITVVSDTINQPFEPNRSLITHPLPGNTQSEYMGAINLDKSNENNCKLCIFDVDKKTVDIDINTDVCSLAKPESCRKVTQEINAVYSTSRSIHNNDSGKSNKIKASTRSLSQEKRFNKSDVKPLGGKELFFKPSQTHNRASQMDGEVRNFLDSLKDIVADKSKMIEDTSKIDTKSIGVDENKYTIEGETQVEEPSKDCQQSQTSDKDQIVKSSIMFPCDCDYKVKFLGVTLKDVNENKKNNKENNQNVNLGKMSREAKQKNDFSQRFGNLQSYTTSLSKLVDNRQENDHHYQPQPARLCNFGIKEFKELFSDLNKKGSSHDIAIDTKSLAKTVVSRTSPCVCCNKDEEVQNLEVNTFHLLKEHLRQKMNDFKENCRSSCIPPEEENKAFSLLLEKIKQTISTATEQVICKCADDTTEDSSWNRAYILLQEYLKTKINRVQCKCSYPIEQNVSLLPEVSAKVCSLIERDFQRLKGLCKCLNKSVCEKDNFDNRKFQIPEKDTSNMEKKSKKVSNTSIIITQTVSAQVQPNLVMVAKSCEVFQEKVEPKSGVEIIDITSDSKKFSPKTSDFIIRQCHTLVDKLSSHETKIIAPIPLADINEVEIMNDTKSKIKQLLLTTNEKFKNIERQHYDNKDSEKKDPLSLPLIGYTVDCTCENSLGQCVCPKATVQKNNRKIEEIWYEVLSTSNKKLNNENISYIMDNVKNTSNKSVDKMCLHEIPQNVCIRHLLTTDNIQQVNRDITVIDNKTSVENTHSGLMLKDSIQKSIFPTHNTTNTDIEYVSNLESDNSVEDSRSDYDSSPSIPESTKAKSVRFPGQSCIKRTKSETQADSFSKPNLQSCDCSTVPICHVKMLVENIERKLIQSDCTCDSLDSKVCPVHSRKPV